MNTKVINNADIKNINVASTRTVIIIEPATDQDIKLIIHPVQIFTLVPGFPMGF